jgi:Class III cytochrome C family
VSRVSKFKVAVEPSPVASQETGKQRALRVGLDYFKGQTPLEKWKMRLWIGVLVLTLPVGAYFLFAGQRNVSRGPVASVHAAWDSNCQACHESFSGVGIARLWGGSVSHEASDAKCQECHLGTEHHSSAKEPAGASCGSCHRDHRGRDASLVRLGDSDCTSCHAMLDKHMKDGSKPSYHADSKHEYSTTITNFATNHPKFALATSDPGNIKFNHAKHLKPGQEDNWTLENIKKANPDVYLRYKNAPHQTDKDDKAFVVLDCASCHVLEPGDAVGKGSKAPGAYYQAISFETNCKACHALTFDKAPKMLVKDANGKPVDVPLQTPHHIQPSDVGPFLWGVYANTYLKDKGIEQFKKDLEASLNHQPSRPLPGKGSGAAKQKIDEQVEKAQMTLFHDQKLVKERIVQYACLKCHYFDDAMKPASVMPSDIPVVWQTHAKFNHRSHRAMECRSCHSQVDTATTKDAVMLPDIENCRQCHAPAGSKAGLPTGGVRHDCTGCHSYHNGDHAAQGLGAAGRNPKTLLNSQDLLNGRK